MSSAEETTVGETMNPVESRAVRAVDRQTPLLTLVEIFANGAVAVPVLGVCACVVHV